MQKQAIEQIQAALDQMWSSHPMDSLPLDDQTFKYISSKGKAKQIVADIDRLVNMSAAMTARQAVIAASYVMELSKSAMPPSNEERIILVGFINSCKSSERPPDLAHDGS